MRVFGERVAAHLGKYGMSPALALPKLDAWLEGLDGVGLIALYSQTVEPKEIMRRAAPALYCDDDSDDGDTVLREHVRAAIDGWCRRARQLQGIAKTVLALVGDSGEMMASDDKLTLSGLNINGLKVTADLLLVRLDNFVDDMAAAFEGETPDDTPTAWKPPIATESDRAEQRKAG